MPTTASDDPAVHCVALSREKWADVLAGHRPGMADVARRITSNEDIWIVLTYLRLRAMQVSVSIGAQPRRDAINLVDGIHVDPERVVPELFLVGCRGDGHYPAICQHVIHQNLVGRDDEPSIYIPQWSQPDLLPRAGTRLGVTNIGFLGHHEINLARRFRDAFFLQQLRARGCELVIKGKAASGVSWNDYSQLDVVLAVRDIPPGHLRNKPVNKLTNAWLAGVPAMIGPEPAIHAIRQSPLDYFEIEKPADVFEVLDRLKAQPTLYQEMVAHGKKRVTSYTDAAVAQRWLEVIEGLKLDFRRWNSMSADRKRADHRERVARSTEYFARHCELVHEAYLRLGYGERWWESGEAVSPPAMERAGL